MAWEPEGPVVAGWRVDRDTQTRERRLVDTVIRPERYYEYDEDIMSMSLAGQLKILRALADLSERVPGFLVSQTLKERA